MPLYTFYPFTREGGALSFAARALPSDEAAMSHAWALFAQHQHASAIEIWHEERMVFRALRDQVQPPGKASCTRKSDHAA